MSIMFSSYLHGVSQGIVQSRDGCLDVLLAQLPGEDAVVSPLDAESFAMDVAFELLEHGLALP